MESNKLVIIACSTGGPKALQRVIPRLPSSLKAPILVVQHMPEGFTGILAERLDGMSKLCCKEALQGERPHMGTVYIACGGKHLHLKGGRFVYTDEPPREGVKPCANYLFESAAESSYDEIICVVMTGMGSDATAGIRSLAKVKKVHIIAQNEASSTVFGMPKSIIETGLVNQIVDLDYIAEQIINYVGV